MSIASFTELYEKAVGSGTCVGPFITGHLVIEFLLRKLIQIYDPALSRLADDLNHARLIQLNYDLGTIDDSQRETLVLINKTRNKFAHQITYEPTIEELKALYILAARSFSDLTDGISQGLEALKDAKSINELDEWVILELFVQISYDLHEEYHTRGGDMEEF
jgi:hypothetical protein